ncbi:hypothetical protein FIU95_13740 [Microbulbifer sp. THAF38]|nr:hypothetical protein FIU95_13740 [Microbulbifer sp. THAF38]
MKSFPITKGMRSDIARCMTSKAVEKSVNDIGKEAERLNKVFWKLYEQKLRAVSGIPSTRWPELIQQGIATNCYQRVPKIKVENTFINILHIDGDSAPMRCLTEMLNSDLLQAFRKWIKKVSHYGKHSSITFTTPKPMADMREGEVIEDPELIASIQKLETRIKTTLTAAMGFHSKAMTVLNSCRTAKQLQDLLPEGAKYLPKREPKTKELAPTELAASVTEMLQKGIPPVEQSEAA